MGGQGRFMVKWPFPNLWTSFLCEKKMWETGREAEGIFIIRFVQAAEGQRWYRAGS